MYNWALNKQKLARAIGLSGINPTEELVKKNYINIGGLVELSEAKETIMNENKEEVIETAVEEEVVESPEVVPETVEVSEESTEAIEVAPTTDDTSI